ncbi:hypothetical protein ASD76_11040 [Altererythrobacter sp. Root672]|nr:hypothetical protein ASD76_11040 [Altererythrobacter sp. Root672]
MVRTARKGLRRRSLLSSTALLVAIGVQASLPSTATAQVVTPQQANGTTILLDQPVSISTTATGAAGYNLHALNLDTSLDNPIDSYQLSGRLGLRVKW